MALIGLFILCTIICQVELQNTTESITTDFIYTAEFAESNTNVTPVLDVFPVGRLPCRYGPGLVVGDRKRTKQCCALALLNYQDRWARGSRPLTRHLETLRGWGCEEFHTECNRRLYAYNRFTQLLYDYFCTYDVFVEQCLQELNRTVIAQTDQQKMASSLGTSNNSSNSVTHWKDLLSHLNTSALTLQKLLKPCIQVAQYEREKENYGDFQELNSIEVPGCELTWCGVSGNTLRDRIISLWNCMSTSCHAKIIVIMVACGIMALAITVVNFSVILAIIKNPPLHSSQSTYKISLAVADLVVGVVVLPTCIANLARLVWTRHVEADFSEVEGYQLTNGTWNNTTVNIRDLSGAFSSKFPRNYVNAVGFFTAVSIFTSIFTLTGAGFDRLIAVFKPLSYRKEKADKVAKYICVISWIVSLVMGVLPFLDYFPNGVILSILVTNIRRQGIALYTVAFLVPLVIVWMVNIATFGATRKHSKFRRQLAVASQIKSQKKENRLARTLALMVGVFTINTLPLIILLLSGLFNPYTNTSDPIYLDLNLHFRFQIAEFIAVMLLFSNSFWNFIIYSARNPDFRQAVKKMYRNSSKTLAIALRTSVLISCCRRIAHGGRRRISTLSQLSSYSNTRKKSSTPTIFTKVSSNAPSQNENVEMTSVSTERQTPRFYFDTKATSPTLSSQRVDAMYLHTSEESSEGKKKKNSKSDAEDSSMAEEDSVLRSFAIDANTDRFFYSVMEKVEEDLTPADETLNET